MNKLKEVAYDLPEFLLDEHVNASNYFLDFTNIFRQAHRVKSSRYLAMFGLKFVTIYIFIAALNFCQCGNDEQEVKILSVRCNSSATFVHQNVSCFAKSYSRSISTVNVDAIFKLPVTDIYVS